jgi:hypothetical protein
MNLSWPFTV